MEELYAALVYRDELDFKIVPANQVPQSLLESPVKSDQNQNELRTCLNVLVDEVEYLFGYNPRCLILTNQLTGKEIVKSFMERNEDYINNEDRIAIVRIVCQYMVLKNPLGYYPSSETKHRYAAAIVKAFPYLGTKLKQPQGKIQLNHDVYFHPQAGGFIENHLKEMRRRDDIRKRKPNNTHGKTSESQPVTKRLKKKVTETEDDAMAKAWRLLLPSALATWGVDTGYPDTGYPTPATYRG
ncbi:hypothetical protein OUZ56_011289 [Daphnia magna]|uniref:Uncharacterized protein n=1 Tax=Daphnia magna TaxID=35525 RepID=A0ABQ9YZS1_9CRUS|nr:hypothetical protein OUZ56_011289 [Daphnia magna]